MLSGGSLGRLHSASSGLETFGRLLQAPWAHSPSCTLPPPPPPSCVLRRLCLQGPGSADGRNAERQRLHPGPEHHGEPEGAEAAAPGSQQGLHREREVRRAALRLNGLPVWWVWVRVVHGRYMAAEMKSMTRSRDCHGGRPSLTDSVARVGGGGEGRGLWRRRVTAGTPRGMSCRREHRLQVRHRPHPAL